MASWGSATVVYSASDNTLNDIQTIEIEQGRQWTTDPYDAARMIITCRNLSAWPTPNPKIGQRIRCNLSFATTSENYFVGRITDVEVNYGNKTSMDTAIITCEGGLGYLARRRLNAQALTQKNTCEQAYDAVIASGVDVNLFYANGLSIASAQTYSGNLLDLVNSLIVYTEYGRIAQYGSTVATKPIIKFYPRNSFNTQQGFTDDPSSPAVWVRYETIQFTSGQDNHYTQVTVIPQSLTTQVATNGSTYYGLTVSSLDYSNGQALAHAQYLVNNFSNTDSEIVSLTWKLSAQTQWTSAALKNGGCDDFSSEKQVGQRVYVTFRGTTYDAVLEGTRILITSDDVEFTSYLSPKDVNAYLVLDDDDYGTLGTSVTYPGNKLGF